MKLIATQPYGVIQCTELRKLASSVSTLAEHQGTSSGTLRPKHNVRLKSLTTITLKVKYIIGTCLTVVVFKELPHLRLRNWNIYYLNLQFFSVL